MCSIIGYFKLNKDKIPHKDFVNFGFELMKHRGPDNENFKIYNNESVCLGHQRLSIIDTSSAANQPMESGNDAIIFNGEIYNYSEIKDSTLGGDNFLTGSDTEVLLKGLQKFGVSFLNQTNGMFAFAYFNSKTQELFLGRDRFGVKPLHYMVEDGILYFSSEIKPLIKIKKVLNKNLAVYKNFISHLATDYNEETFIQDIFQLKGGNYLRCFGNNFEVKQWYFGSDFMFDESIFKSHSNTIKFTEDLLLDAIGKRLRADVPLCITLSGGLDSAVIYTLIKERLGYTITPFTFVNTDSTLSEIDKVEKLTSQYGDKVNKVYINPVSSVSEIKDSLSYLEFPIWSPSVVAFTSVYDAIAKQGYKVVIEGHGSDEQLGGYPFMVESAILEFMRKGQFFQAWTALKVYRNIDWTQKESAPLFASIKSIVMRTLLSFVNKDIVASFSQCVHVAFNYKILPIVLRAFDRLTMKSTLESRSPFMDYRLVEFFKKMPTKYKVNELGSKAILREILKKYNKDFIYQDQKKIGFGIDAVKLFSVKENYDFLKEYVATFDIKEFNDLKVEAQKVFDKDCVVLADVEKIWKVASLSIINEKYGL